MTDLMTRQDEIEAFLLKQGWDSAERAALAGDASARRYIRLTGPAGNAMLMDTPPDSGIETEPFVAIAEWLCAEGLSAPHILAQDIQRGLLLLEDLGDDLFVRLCADAPEAEVELFTAAIEVLADLYDKSPPDPVPGWQQPRYSTEEYLRESRLLTQWYLPPLLGAEDAEKRAPEYDTLMRDALAAISPARDVVVLRDYHAENLIWLPDRMGVARVGLLDFQDALIGHPAYDLVSLLRDARRDVPEDLDARMMDHYIDATGVASEPFHQAARILSAQRNCKIIGIFTRLCRRDDKPGYLKMIPRVWNNLMRDLTHPSLGALNDWVALNVPPPTADRLDAIARGAS